MRPLLQWENNKYYILGLSVCSLRYPACSARVSYCHLWPVLLYSLFPALSNKRHHFLACVLIFCKFVSNTFRIL